MLDVKQHCSFSPKPLKNMTTWMSDLPNCLISELTIPGTHDTCAKDAINTILQTQTWSLKHQLEAGIRFLDIRCRHMHNSFKIFHWTFDCGVTFEEVLTTVKSFLSENPSETIIMRIKEEYFPENCNRTFQETFNAETGLFNELFFISDYMPYLDEIRGKIWPVFDFSFDYGFKWSACKIQDYWDIKSEDDLIHKCSSIMLHCEKTILHADRKDLFINFCSGSGFLWPDAVSQVTNKILFDYKGKMGIVVFDYPGEDLICHLISQNYIKQGQVDTFKTLLIIEESLIEKETIKVGEIK
jgi:1-phosphatidylinositol phosphodiesterase